MSAEIVTAVQELLSYLKQAETRRILGSERELFHFHNGADKLQNRYRDAVHSGEDQDFVKALEEAPVPPPYVVSHMAYRAEKAKEAANS